jgi:hypothetical protein
VVEVAQQRPEAEDHRFLTISMEEAMGQEGQVIHHRVGGRHIGAVVAEPVMMPIREKEGAIHFMVVMVAVEDKAALRQVVEGADLRVRARAAKYKYLSIHFQEPHDHCR